jgi:hypothetical protein
MYYFKHNDTVNFLFKQSIDSNTFTNHGPNVKLLEGRLSKIMKIDSTRAVICVAVGSERPDETMR